MAFLKKEVINGGKKEKSSEESTREEKSSEESTREEKSCKEKIAQL